MLVFFSDDGALCKGSVSALDSLLLIVSTVPGEWAEAETLPPSRAGAAGQPSGEVAESDPMSLPSAMIKDATQATSSKEVSNK